MAESFRSEHAAALDFLNDNTTGELNFFAVEVELWRIGNSPLAPKFEVVVKPNDWTKTNRQQARAATTNSPTKQLQLKFWKALIEKLALDAPHIRPQKPRPQHWLNNSIGRAGFGLNFTVNTREDRLGVELWMPDEKAKQHFANLLKQKNDIETQLGFSLDWQELPESKASRIAVWRQNSSLDDEELWPEYLMWFTGKVMQLDTVFRPMIKKLP